MICFYRVIWLFRCKRINKIQNLYEYEMVWVGVVCVGHRGNIYLCVTTCVFVLTSYMHILCKYRELLST